MKFEIEKQNLIFEAQDVIAMLEIYNNCIKIKKYQKLPYTFYTLLKNLATYDNEKVIVRQRASGEHNYVFITHAGEYDINCVQNADFYKWFTEQYWFYRYSFIETSDNGNSYAIVNNDKTLIVNERENDIMKGFNFDFGPVTGDVVRISAYGLAVKNQAGEWVSYNSATNEIFNVDLLNFDANKFVYKMPVAIKDVAIGDVIIHNKIAVFVTAVEDKVIVAIDPRSGEEKRVLLTRSPFGFDYATKLVSFLTMFGNTATADNPFGGFLPFMLMGDNDSIDPMAMLVMMQSQGSGTAMFSNPMMMYLLMKDNGNKDALLPLMMMSQMNK